MLNNKSLIESVSIEENPTARDVPLFKGLKRKSLALALELQPIVQRSK